MFETVSSVPLYAQVAARIRDAIVSGSYAPGDVLPTELELAEAFGVSRPSVREALRHLEAQGLVGGARTAQARRVAAGGVEVVTRALEDSLALSGVALDDLVELRCAIEAAALRRAAVEPVPAELVAARDALEEMGRPGVDPTGFDAADVRFHTALVGASGNRAMHAVMLAARGAQERHLGAALARDPRPGRTVARLRGEHRAIYDAVAAGDGDRAAALVQAHILGFYHRRTAPR